MSERSVVTNAARVPGWVPLPREILEATCFTMPLRNYISRHAKGGSDCRSRVTWAWPCYGLRLPACSAAQGRKGPDPELDVVYCSGGGAGGEMVRPAGSEASAGGAGGCSGAGDWALRAGLPSPWPVYG